VSAPRLTKVRLERFKAAFKPGEIALGPFNVIIGRNGSGKSTLLEALQWVDTTLRHDTRRASQRYYGVHDLINLRGDAEPRYFEVALWWCDEQDADWFYGVKIVDDNGLATVEWERLTSGKDILIDTASDGSREVREPDRLALGRHSPAFLREFWERAVFLRLSPTQLAMGSPAKRLSYEPLLDEEGQMLPALLNELDDEQRESLVEAVKEILPGIEGIEVSEASGGRDVRVHYSLLERMPYRGRSGMSQFPIPAWMLSEGTRRLTAILALLHRDPAPSLLCIEEVENGLDPWTVQTMLGHLQQAARRGIQVVVTTHSPWLLDHVPIDSIVQVRRKDGDTIYERFSERPEVQAYDPRVPAGTRYVNEAE
jgi:predicted ATPase